MNLTIFVPERHRNELEASKSKLNLSRLFLAAFLEWKDGDRKVTRDKDNDRMRTALRRISKIAESAQKEEEEDEEDEDIKAFKQSKKEATKAEKPAKGKGNLTSGRGPGIVAAIRAMMSKTNQKNPMTVEVICERLKELFPDHKPDGFKKTVTGQVSYFLKKAPPKGLPKLNIKNAGKGLGYYVSDKPIEE